MRTMRASALALLLGVLLPVAFTDDDADASVFDEDGDAFEKDYGYGVEDDVAEEDEVTTAVYIIEHGFLGKDVQEWLPRGTLLLSRTTGQGYEARLSDSKEFLQIRTDLAPMMARSADGGNFYAIRMYNPENPKRALQASIPANLLNNHFEDWHDIMEVTVGSAGVPVSLSYRVRHTLGLSLFDHTQVHISEPSNTEGPRVNAAAQTVRRPDGTAGPAPKPQEPPGMMGMLRKYWWVVLIGMVLLSNAGDDGAAGGKASGGKASGGGGGGGARRA